MAVHRIGMIRENIMRYIVFNGNSRAILDTYPGRTAAASVNVLLTDLRDQVARNSASIGSADVDSHADIGALSCIPCNW